MNYNYILGFILFFTITFFFGCDDDSTGPGDGGSFTVKITGDVNREFSGSAVFAITTQPEEGFSLILMSGDEGGESALMVSFLIGTTSPGKGTHPIGENATRTVFASWYTSGKDKEYFFSESGSMTVTTATDKLFAGSFQYTATGWTGDDNETDKEVTISGNFDAIGGWDFSD
jgi:hypothetical protein